MEVLATSAVPAPKDRVIMVIDMNEESPMWEFALWHDQALRTLSGMESGGWCIADHWSLVESMSFDDTPGIATCVIDAPTHWAEVPARPAHNAVAKSESAVA